MKVLMFSEDPSILVANSPARKRMEFYARILGELHIVVEGMSPTAIISQEGLFLHPVFGRFGVWSKIMVVWLAVSLCRKHKFEVITVQAPDETGFVGFLLGRFFKTSLQIQIHTDILSPYYRRASWKEFLRYLIALFLIPRAHCLRVVSKRIANSLNSKFTNFKSKISVLPIFTDTEKFLQAQSDPVMEERLRGYDFKMVAVGRFVEKEKNFSMLIRVMREVTKGYPRAVLFLTGDGPDKVYYERQIKNYGLEKNIFLEKVRYDDLPSFLKSFDLFLMPSNYEGWGLIAEEAMASGLPVIMTDVGLAEEVVKNGENGFIVPVGGEKEMAEKIFDLVRDAAQRKRISLKATETVKKFGVSLSNYRELYKKSFECCKK